MPPRIRTSRLEQLVQPPSFSQNICLRCRRHARLTGSLRRTFSSTTITPNKLRREMWEWFEGPGAALRETNPEGTNYLGNASSRGDSDFERLHANAKKLGLGKGGSSKLDTLSEDEIDGLSEEELQKLIDEANDLAMVESEEGGLQPFPMNQHFVSESVLSEKLKDEIWKKIMVEKKSVRQVSVELSVDMNRVGAVIRLKGVEEQWKKENKPLATAYSKAIMKMLPVTAEGEDHESINDLPTHRATKEQIFYPASESRVFTRADAGIVFAPGLLPADQRIPHPQLVQMHRDQAAAMATGVSEEEAERTAKAKLEDFYTTELRQRQSDADRRRDRHNRNTVEVEGTRSVFRISNVTVDEHTVGKDGRDPRGVGARYAVPSQDRKKGQVKIPTKV